MNNMNIRIANKMFSVLLGALVIAIFIVISNFFFSNSINHGKLLLLEILSKESLNNLKKNNK